MGRGGGGGGGKGGGGGGGGGAGAPPKMPPSPPLPSSSLQPPSLENQPALKPPHCPKKGCYTVPKRMEAATLYEFVFDVLLPDLSVDL